MVEVKQETVDLSAPTGGQGAFLYTLHLADNALIIGQRNSEWTGHGPVLEQDIAITNIALDYLGQARNFYQYAASLYNDFSEKDKLAVDNYIPRIWKEFNRELQEDDLAFLRDEHQYLNLLITELPKGDWAFSILRQFFFSAFQFFQYQKLQKGTDAQLAAIAEKSVKETAYHLRWSAEWVIRLGDGTEESSSRIKNALSELWMFTGEMFMPAPYEEIDVSSLNEDWRQKIQTVFNEATLTPQPMPHPASLPSTIEKEKGNEFIFGEGPGVRWSQTGGKQGQHTEHLGFLLATMQHLQRSYPNATW